MSITQIQYIELNTEPRVKVRMIIFSPNLVLLDGYADTNNQLKKVHYADLIPATQKEAVEAWLTM